ncbi:trypsin [Fructilactobacillus lindneri]|uniref:PDZ domain-containing protein n=1 Tax=Fructilactobacillus lindneri DSM 20690 = JCM 11027 TaxID=1122148 RepID=A0A0R2JWC5_9LACO|nr:PDZ domain-containing protein [Fructilactobacillus lindneri]KRN79292.1 hypothetical protein IV52_GL000701 [Fructilactobacillus lindneri DSM 20690 = JCM 11027]POH05487.1 trypsin [Fructilactobacillus lindneri]POH07924.1 trypsin [Fructilactobacillus lindneri]POH24488.1 trypsin [Fructilactobacillus lindneri DSM 20690 = JCM 11027]SJZ70399.1 PDZ domain-containing protein [Fructilactobacillus lindneri DSM 20690 = JCM 11027]
MELALNILFFLIVPTFWLGIIRTYLSYRSRLKRERSLYDSAINPKNTEMRTFFISLIVLGIIGSLFTSLVGIEVSYVWIIFYEIVITIALLIPGLMIPFTVLFGTMIIILIFGNKFYSNIISGHFKITLQNTMPEGLDFLALITAMLIIQYVFLKINRKSVNSPIITKNIRGNKIASYVFNKMTVVPLVLFVPGSLFESTSPLWHVFKIFGAKLTILVVPFLIGFRFKFMGEMPEKLLKRMANAIGWLAWLSLGLMIDAFIWKNLWFDIASIVVIFAAYLLILRHYKKVDQNEGKTVEQSIDGIRILAVKPNTPAAKMNLKIGDLIQEVNGKPVKSENQLYKALQSNPTFCRLKIKNRNGKLEMKESAIYAGSPHEIGIVTFPNN